MRSEALPKAFQIWTKLRIFSVFTSLSFPASMRPGRDLFPTFMPGNQGAGGQQGLCLLIVTCLSVHISLCFTYSVCKQR